MGHAHRSAVLLSLLTWASTVQAEEADQWIAKLNDADPNIRAQAFDKLSAMGDAARPALRAASRSPRPAIAEGATSLLMRLPWTRPGDPPDSVNLLRDYGRNDTDGRASRLSQLLNSENPAIRIVALRVAKDEPSDEVLWDSFGSLSADATFHDVLKDVNPDDVRPAVLHLIARQRLRDRDPKAMDLFKRLLDQEVERPTATRAQLAWAVQQLVSQSRSHEDRVAAATYLRHLLSLASDTEDDTRADLFLLQALDGPLPGLITDMTPLADAERDPRTVLAMARLARRIGASVPAALLAESALTLPEIGGNAEANRQLAIGIYLLRLRDAETAERVLKPVSDLNDAENSTASVNASLQLYDLYSRRQNHLAAAQRLEKAVTSLGGNASLISNLPNGETEVWPLDEVQARITWHYYKDAEQRSDATESRKRLIELAGGQSGDMSIFLDVYPALAAAADAIKVDAYFDRVYEKQNNRVKAAPADAMHKNDLAWLCARADRKLEEALTLAQEATRLKPNEPGYIDTLAEANFRLGKIDEALRQEEAALRLKPDDTFMKEQLDRFRKAAATQPAGQK